MSKSHLLWGCALVLAIGGLVVAGCAPQAQSEPADKPSAEESGALAATGLDPLASWQLSDTDDPMELANGVYEALDERAAQYEPEVRTLDDGTRIQRTPDGWKDSTLQVKDNISFNLYRLDADNRGCSACHEDLAATAANIAGYPHMDFTDNAIGVEWTESTCRGCHIGHFDARYEDWSGLIHGIHTESRNQKFVEEGGTCWSCHYGKAQGGDESGMQLWDNVKHKVMHGLTNIKAEDQTGEFTYNQDKTVSAEEMFNYAYISGRDNEAGLMRWGRDRLGLTPPADTSADFNEWTIDISGACDSPQTVSLTDLIANNPVTTQVFSGQCYDNGPGGSLVYQIEATGVLLSDIMQTYGASPDVQSVIVTANDGSSRSYPVERVNNGKIIVVYQVGDDPLSYGFGYPVTVMTPGSALDARRELVGIEFSTEPAVKDQHKDHGAEDQDGVNYIYPNVGISGVREGQIIKAGEPFTFEGYVEAMNDSIVNIEVSMDLGKTWKTFETPDNDWMRWTWWTYTWTPEQPGAYTVTVRATAPDGTVSTVPAEKMVIVEE